LGHKVTNVAGSVGKAAVAVGAAATAVIRSIGLIIKALSDAKRGGQA
jgi:hypothetical protein